MRQKKPRKGSSLDDYVRQKKAKDPVFAEGFDEGLQELQVGMILKMARKEAKMTQREVAEVLGTQTSVISRLETKASDMKVSTFMNYLKAVGKELRVA